jgi:hypothetical protein
MSEFDVPLFHFSRGEFIEADYQDPLLEDYRNNPLLEALPPIWDDKINWHPSQSSMLRSVTCLFIFVCTVFNVFRVTFFSRYQDI